MYIYIYIHICIHIYNRRSDEQLLPGHQDMEQGCALGHGQVQRLQISSHSPLKVLGFKPLWVWDS